MKSFWKLLGSKSLIEGVFVGSMIANIVIGNATAAVYCVGAAILMHMKDKVAP